MKLPSIKRLNEAFPGKGREIRELLEKKRKTRAYESVQQLERQCYHPPRYLERLMTALDEVINGGGVDAVWCDPDDQCPEATYINTGDPYNVTLVFDHDRAICQVLCLADWVERFERRTGRTIH